MWQLLAYTGADFKRDLGNLTVIIVGAAGAMMTLYAIYIGFLFATASDPNKRKAARERLIKTVASALIIIGLASVLGAINVRFNRVEGNVSGTNGGGNGNYSSQYMYSGSIEMPLYNIGNKYVTGSFKIYSTNIKSDGKNIDPNGTEVQFQKCEVVEPSGWKNEHKTPFDTSKVGEGAYAFQCSSTEIPCTMVNGIKAVTMAVTFTMKSDTSRTFSLKINVGLSEGNGGVTLVQY